MVNHTPWKKWIIIGGMLPALIFYLVLGVTPSIVTVFLSFTNVTGVKDVPWQFIGLKNYFEFFGVRNSRDTVDIMLRTVIFALAVTVIQNILALLAAVLLNSKKLIGRNFVRAIAFLPTILGVTVTAYTWTLFFDLDGPASAFLKIFHTQSLFFGGIKTAFPLVIFVQIWFSLGYAMVIDLAGLQSISQELYEAADIDGADSTRRLRYITVPLMWQTLSVNILLSVIGSLSVVQTILLTTGGAHDSSTLALSVFANGFSFQIPGGSPAAMRQGYAAAQSMILFLLILIVTVGLQLLVRRRNKDI